MVVAAAIAVVVGSMVVQLATDLTVRVGSGVAVTTVLLVAGAIGARRRRRYGDAVLALAALSVFGWVSALITRTEAVSRLIESAPPATAFLVVNATKLSAVAVLVVIAALRGWSLRGMLLTRGQLDAPTGVPGLRWTVAGPLVIIAVTMLFLTDPAVTAAPWTASGVADALLPVLPLLVAGPLLNAVAEEILYRNVPIRTMQPVVGAAPAVIISSTIFGIAHLTGSPPGWIGVAATLLYGLVVSTALLRTRGVFWGVVIHVFADLAAVIALTLAAVPR